MSNKKGSGIHLVFSEIPPEKEEDFNRWYDEEHVRDILALPGVLDAARYVAVIGGPKYLTCYELERPEVMESPAYRKLRANPTEWTNRASPKFIATEFISNVYQQIFPAEVSAAVAQSDMAPTLHIGRLSVAPESEDEFNEWYNTLYIPEFEKIEGCIRGRRYTAVSGEPKYVTVWELRNDQVSRSEKWAAARDVHPQSAQWRARITHAPGSLGVYNKIFPL